MNKIVTIKFENHNEAVGFSNFINSNDLFPEKLQTRFIKRRSIFWYLLKIFFPKANIKEVYIAFFGNVYCPPHLDTITPDLAIHELVHIRQQNIYRERALARYVLPALWAFFYIINKNIRFNFEFEAYVKQLQYFKETGTTINKNILQKIGTVMSSDMYGNMVEFPVVYKKLRDIFL